MIPSDIMWSLLEAIETTNPTFYYLAKQEDGKWFSKDDPEVSELMDNHGPIIDALFHTELYENTLKVCICLCVV